MITNYAELLTAVEDWTHRKDVSSYVPEWVQLGESRIKNDLVLKPIEAAQHGTMTSAVIQPPANVEQLQRLMYYKDGREVTPQYSASSPVEFSTSSVGAPKFWTQQDQAIALYPTPDAQYRYSLYYIPTLAPLSVANATNWLLGKSPDVYLYAALMHFAMWAKDDAQANGFLSMYTSTLDAARNSANRYRLALASPMRQRVNGSKIV